MRGTGLNTGVLLLAAGLVVAACGGTPSTPLPPPDGPPPSLPPAVDPNGVEFTFAPAGELVPGSGNGRQDVVNFAPNMRFPLERAPAYANSQVYAPGGSQPPPDGAGQCDIRNYSYPWRDNFCERRRFDAPLCPDGNGHQGQDIRGATCQDAVHWAVATEAGQITGIGSFSVTLAGDTGTIYRYLHLDMGRLAVSRGDRVERGQRLGLVSNDFGGTPTTIHLHFDMRQAIALDDGRTVLTFVHPYPALIASYEALLRGQEP